MSTIRFETRSRNRLKRRLAARQSGGSIVDLAVARANRAPKLLVAQYRAGKFDPVLGGGKLEGRR